ncbi:acetyl-CoA C-acyltransferase, partial [Staphylococcus sp. SIMBA_130]
GITAENLAQKYQLTREALDAYAAESQQRTEWAQKNGRFDNEIVPIKIVTRKEERYVKADEFPRHGTTRETLARLRPAFRPDGVVT